MDGEIMSAMWLIPQYILYGLAEAFKGIGQLEFYYSQFPKSLASVAGALITLATGFGNLVGSLTVDMVDDYSTKDGKLSWLDDNLNRGRYDSYYWLLTILGLANFLYYCLCCWAYGSSEKGKIWDEDEKEGVDEGREMEDLPKSNESPIVFAP